MIFPPLIRVGGEGLQIGTPKLGAPGKHLMLLLMILLLAGTATYFRPSAVQFTYTSQLRLSINSSWIDYLLVISSIVMWNHSVLVRPHVTLLARCLDPHWDLQVCVKPLNGCSVCGCSSRRLTGVFAVLRVSTC